MNQIINRNQRILEREKIMLQKQASFLKVWQILSPIAVYYVVSNVMMYCLILVFRINPENYMQHYMMLQTLATALVFPIVYGAYQKDKLLYTVFHQRMFYELKEVTKKQRYKVAGLTVLCSIFAALALNNILTLTGISKMSQGYQQATEHFFAGNVFYEVVGVGILIPIVEELLYRGIVYGKLCDWIGIQKAAILSSLIFGILHFNLVQFIYAFFMGILLVFFLEKNHSLFGSILAHIAANLSTVLRVETGCLKWMEKSQILYVGMTVFMIVVSIGLLISLKKSDRANEKN